MAGCDADTGSVVGDYAYLTDYSKYSVFNGKHGFKNQLLEAYSESSGGYTNFSTSVNFNSSHDVDLYMEGSDIAARSMYLVAIFLPLDSYKINMKFRTLIECSVKMHIKFIEITDPSHAWNMTSFDDTPRTEDILYNQIITFYNSISPQTIEFNEPDLSGKEGYFIVLWSSAEEINSGNNGSTDYGFQIDYELTMRNQKALDWINRSKSYNVAPEEITDPYLVPEVVLSTIYDSCTVSGTRCDQIVYPAGAQWRYPCSIEVIEIIDTQDDGFTFTYYHDDQFSTIESSATHKEFITITDTVAGTSISSPNLNINVVSDGVNKWRVDITGRDPDTEYSVEIRYKNDTGAVVPYETSKTFIIRTEEANNEIDAPILYNVAQEKTTPDRITVRFVEIENVDSYDLIVRTGGVLVTSHHISPSGVGTNQYVNTDGLNIGTVYDFELIANVSSPWIHGNNNHRNGVMKIGWLDDAVITLTSTIDSITVTYPPVVNAETYIIVCTRVDNGVSLPYGGPYNSPYTIGGLATDKEYKITIDAFDDDGIYKTSHSFQNIFTLNPIPYLDKPQVKYTNTGSVSAGSDNMMFELNELVNNADRYEIIINGVVNAWNPIAPYNIEMFYGTAYSVVVKAYNDTHSIESESHEINITLYKKLMNIEPANQVKYAHGSNDNTDEINIYVGFDTGRSGETLITTLEDMNCNLLNTRTTVIANNLIDNDSFTYNTNHAEEYIVRSWFEVPKTWGGDYEAKSIEKVCRIRALADTDNDGHADNHPTNPDMDNPNTTYGYGDGLGL